MLDMLLARVKTSLIGATRWIELDAFCFIVSALDQILNAIGASESARPNVSRMLTLDKWCLLHSLPFLHFSLPSTLRHSHLDWFQLFIVSKYSYITYNLLFISNMIHWLWFVFTFVPFVNSGERISDFSSRLMIVLCCMTQRLYRNCW